MNNDMQIMRALNNANGEKTNGFTYVTFPRDTDVEIIVGYTNGIEGEGVTVADVALFADTLGEVELQFAEVEAIDEKVNNRLAKWADK